MESLGWSSTSGREAFGNLVITSRITLRRASKDAAWAMFTGSGYGRSKLVAARMPEKSINEYSLDLFLEMVPMR
jgi:hypothetical protein